MKNIGIIVNWGKKRATETLCRVAHTATSQGMSVIVDERAAAVANGLPLAPLSTFADTVEAVVVLGGDGTMLEAAKALQGSGLPLMGLNIGSLGYLTCVGEDEFTEAIQALAHGTFTRDQRTTIAGVITQPGTPGTKLPDALNEVVVSRGCSGRLGWFNLEIDGEVVANVGCDGIVVATPTGSTAYALASGGPLLHPNTPALVITAISPHALTFRPLVVPDKSCVAITLAPNSSEAIISVDGRDNLPMSIDTRLELRLSPRSVTLLHHADYNPCAVMNRKLGWCGR